MQQQAGTRKMLQEAVTQSRAFGRAFDQAWDIGHDETAVLVYPYHAQIGVQGSKRVISYFWTGGRHCTNQRGFSRIWHAKQSHVGQNLELQFQVVFFSRFAQRKLPGCAIGTGFEVQIAESTRAAFRQQHFLLMAAAKSATVSPLWHSWMTVPTGMRKTISSAPFP